MFICATCDQPIGDSDSCKARPGLRTRREELRYLIEEAGWEPFELLDHCRDCGTAIDGYHHPMCCVAMCFNAHGPDGRTAQRLMCSCDVDPMTGKPYH
jgi:hypothetical protein